LKKYTPIVKDFLSIKNGSRKGETAGWKDKDGYIQLYFQGKTISLHKLVFMYFNDREPDGFLDHKNGDRTDCRPCNLREATREENNQNRSKHEDNQTGFKGVVPYGEKFRAYIKIDGVTKNLGTFETAEEAGKAYQKVAKEAHGEFFTNR
jgi:hypothetical protein